jgi:hypothetical protein
VTKTANGVETLTESANVEVAPKLAVHVEAMHKRLLKGRPIHMRDPLFREIFRNADKIKMTVEKTPQGVKVSETSKDPYVAKLIQAHAEVLNQFLAKGHEEVRNSAAAGNRNKHRGDKGVMRPSSSRITPQL